MGNLLILTVGAGAAGQHSDLHTGLTATIRAIRPRRYWLAPSADRNSIAMAEMMRDTCPDGFTPRNETTSFYAIPKHDDIFDCRAVMRQAIAAAKPHLRTGEKLLVNPTSGTKQMSAGATLAAMDEEIGDLVFTVGERADGVVKTGTERLASFATRDFFMDRDLRSADILFRNGAYRAAAQLLDRYADSPAVGKARARALCMFEWQRLNYAPAATQAALFDQRAGEYLRGLARDVADNRPSLPVLRDLLRGADALRRWDDCDEAVTRYYKALEYATRLRLAQALQTTPPFKIRDLQKLPLPARLLGELHARNDGMTAPGLAWMLQALAHLGNPLADACQADKALLSKLRVRNERVHEIRPAQKAEAQSFCDRLNNLFANNIPELADVRAQAPTPPEKLLTP